MKPKGKVGTPVARHGGARSSLFGIAATLALIVGYFMPWTATSGAIRGALGLGDDTVVTSADRSKDARVKEIAMRLQAGEPVSGSQWNALLDAVEAEGRLEPRQQRAVEIARVGTLLLPYATGALALLLLALGVAPARAMKAGLGPVAAMLAIAQSRLLSALLLVLTMAVAVLVLAFTTILWGSAEFVGTDHAATGTGLKLMVAGSGAALISGFLGYGPGRLRALIWSLVLVAAFAGFVAYRLESG